MDAKHGPEAPTDLLVVRQAQEPGPAQRAERIPREGAAGLRLRHLREELPGGDLAGQLEERGGLLAREQSGRWHAATLARARVRSSGPGSP